VWPVTDLTYTITVDEHCPRRPERSVTDAIADNTTFVRFSRFVSGV